MSKKRILLLYPLLCLLLTFSMAVPVFAQPPPTPHSFYGTVTIDGAPATAGTVIDARGTGVFTAVPPYNPITTTVEGEYGSSSPLGPWLVVQGYIDEGTPIGFYVNNVQAQLYDVAAQASSDTYAFHSGTFTELNLIVGTPPAQYTLMVASTAGGSVTNPGEGTFTRNAGTEVTLVAQADAGYEFLNWTGAVSTVADVNATSTTITMNGNYSITANFAEIGITYDLTVASTAGGSVTTPGEGIFTRNAGTEVTLVAQADAGYEFLNWTGAVSTVADVNAASTTITMNGNYSITANFKGAFDPWIYDTNGDGELSKAETLVAIADYNADTITKNDVLAVVILYFLSP